VSLEVVQAPAGVLLYKVSDATRILNMSKWAIYEQIRRGRLHTVVQGRARLIPAAALVEYVELLQREAQGKTR
jgi:excisionase family DNA binding protein